MAKCSGVTPGGKDALVCLQKNVAGLSPACKTAVSATIPPARPGRAAKPARRLRRPPRPRLLRRHRQPRLRRRQPPRRQRRSRPVDRRLGAAATRRFADAHATRRKPRAAGRRNRSRRPAPPPQQAVVAPPPHAAATGRGEAAECAGGDDRRDRPRLPARSGAALPRYRHRRRPEDRLPDRARRKARARLQGGAESHRTGTVTLAAGATLRPRRPYRPAARLPSGRCRSATLSARSPCKRQARRRR